MIHHRGVAKRCQGCCQIGKICIFIDVLLHRVPQIVNFNSAGVPLNFFKDLNDAVNQKRLKNNGVFGLNNTNKAPEHKDKIKNYSYKNIFTAECKNLHLIKKCPNSELGFKKNE